MHISLAEVFVNRIVRDEDGLAALALRVPRLVVLGHAGQQRRTCLPFVLSSDR